MGSSIMARWQSIDAAFPGASMRNIAVGDTQTSYWTTRIPDFTAQSKAQVVLCYCGSNDVNAHIDPEVIIVNLRTIAQAVLGNGQDFIYYAIIKAPQKYGRYAEIDTINQSIADYFDDAIRVIDCNALLCPDLTDVSGCYQADGLHLTDLGYERMALCTRDQFFL